jgi:hypothetical protein
LRPGFFFLGFVPDLQDKDYDMSATNAAGVKRKCLSCAAAFFDLGRTPITCPKCAAEFKVVELPRRYAAPAPGAPTRPFSRPSYGKPIPPTVA